MILVDTSVWIDHFRTGVRELECLIEAEQVLSHPFVTGELAVGALRNWNDAVTSLRALPRAKVASEAEFLTLIVSGKLAASGLGFVDVHLLASCRLAPETWLWSRDKRLARHADMLNLAWTEA